jgi:hypothetical protein
MARVAFQRPDRSWWRICIGAIDGARARDNSCTRRKKETPRTVCDACGAGSIDAASGHSFGKGREGGWVRRNGCHLR